MESSSSPRAFWGCSPALNLCEEYTMYIGEKHIKNNELNILLYGNIDSRHILKTISKLYERQINVNFYALDNRMEIIGRNMLLILTAFENKRCLTLSDKTHIFMDIYGNTFLRPISSQYIAIKSRMVLKMLNDSNYMRNIAPILNIDLLRYYDLDILEGIFKFWSFNGYDNYDIKLCWDRSMRNNLGSRYDVRDGVFDWDFRYLYNDIDTKYLTFEEYKKWRETGIAFTFHEYEQTQPNRTLCNHIENIGIRYKIDGYDGDVSCGPYFTFGMDLMNIRLLKANRMRHNYRSTDITKKNLYEIMYEIEQKQEYNEPPSNTEKSPDKTGPNDKSLQYEQKIIDIVKPKTKINFITKNTIVDKNGLARDEWKNKFDLTFISSDYFSEIFENFFSICRDDKSMIIFETKHFATCDSRTSKNFLENIKKFARNNNLKSITKFKLSNNISTVRCVRDLNAGNPQ